MNDYISKPFKEKDLHQLLQHYLGPVESEPVPANDTTISRSPANKLINLDDLYALARGNQEFIQEMISIFLEQNPEDTKALQDAAKSANYQQLRSIAHRMKTSVGFMGMKSLLSPLSEIELLAEKNESIEVIRKKTDSLIEQCQEACKELNQELTKPSRV
jgi:HPt (histidine-containing phosphotransfer) domain-containing protein